MNPLFLHQSLCEKSWFFGRFVENCINFDPSSIFIYFFRSPHLELMEEKGNPTNVKGSANAYFTTKAVS